AVHGDGEQARIELLENHFVCAHGWCFRCCWLLLSFRDGAPAPDPESRDPGFDASHRPGMTLRVTSSPAGSVRIPAAGMPRCRGSSPAACNNPSAPLTPMAS